MFVATAFRPNAAYNSGIGVNVAPGVATSGAVSLNRTGPTRQEYSAFRFCNRGTDPVAVNFGAATTVVDPTITAAQLVLLPNSVEIIDLPPEITHFKHIGVAGGNNLHIMEGNGL